MYVRTEHRADGWNRVLDGHTIATLFVPGTRPDRVARASERGARAIVIDLEDAVLPEHKAEARAQTARVLGGRRAPDVAYLVRLNSGAEPGLLEHDLVALRDVLPALDAVVLPKAASADEVRSLAERLPPATKIIPTIESAVGVREAWAIAAASPKLHTLMFGSVDMSAELGVTMTAEGHELATARSTVVLACAAAGLSRPLDGPYTNITDTAGLRTASQAARRLGFGGKVVIHPSQLVPVMDSFAPTLDQVDWAQRVLEAYDTACAAGTGVVRMADGTFIDVPVAEQARTILRAAEFTTIPS